MNTDAAAERSVSPLSELPTRITLITRSGCHLCEPAREVVRTVAQESGVAWEELDVDADRERAERFGEMVPVVLVDGRQHDYFTIDPMRLRGALSGRRGWLGRSPRLGD